MNFVQALFLAVLQGITEFLPVSSSGHLVIFQKLFGFKEAPLFFDILLHVGTFASIVAYFRRPLFGLLKFEKKDRRFISLIILGTVPAVLVGLLAKNQIESSFNSLKMTGISFLISALFLISTKWVNQINKANKEITDIKAKDAFIVGIFQAVAILPGVSRSGSTITGSLWQGFSSKTAFVFSFYLAMPAILGAAVLEIKDITAFSTSELWLGFLGLTVSALVGYFALKFLDKILKSAKIWYFSFYCLVLGMILLFV